LSSQGEKQPEDDVFIELAQRHLDIDALLSYNLFLQACILSRDNIYNNQYIWMFWENGRYVFKMSPWDMDKGFGGTYNKDGSPDIRFHFMQVASRILGMDLMDSRRKLHDIWQEKRKTVISDEALQEMLMSTEEWINSSGAYLRESEKWYGEARPLNLREALYHVNNQMKTVEDLIGYFWPIKDAEAVEQ